MRNHRGFSLVEMLVVIAILGIMAAIGVPNLTNFVRKSRIENQIRRIYSDLMNARAMAMNKSMTHFVVFAGNTYTIIADTSKNDQNDGVPTDTQVLVRTGPEKTPFTYSHSALQDETTGDTIGGWIAFNSRGIARTNNAPNGTISIQVTGVHPSLNCISISPTQMRLGKLSSGGDCESK